MKPESLASFKEKSRGDAYVVDFFLPLMPTSHFLLVILLVPVLGLPFLFEFRVDDWRPSVPTGKRSLPLQSKGDNFECTATGPIQINGY